MVPKTYTIPIQENHLGVKKFTIAANLFELPVTSRNERGNMENVSDFLFQPTVVENREYINFIQSLRE